VLSNWQLTEPGAEHKDGTDTAAVVLGAVDDGGNRDIAFDHLAVRAGDGRN
jgi:hypothetical protein